ncbi:MAG: ATP-binding cassette domain-containing protein, partial [Lentisphaeraceae bacterium]|nr:ATP-binding cassette domain-containing protein [Lentisphaeraceae bacterium]
MANQQQSPVLSVEGLIKDYPGVRAVNDVSFSVESSTVHCLIGENGAGKTTLMTILFGHYAADEGSI